MNDKFDPATVDKYSESSVTAVKEDLEADDKLKAGLIGGSFPPRTQRVRRSHLHQNMMPTRVER
jgi:hypothetical protein